jgi:hypothetical protein
LAGQAEISAANSPCLFRRFRVYQAFFERKKTMKNLKTAALALLAATTLAAPGVALAATDGTAGATSTGTLQATMTVTAPTQPTIVITELEDVALGIFSQSSLTTAGNIFTGSPNFFCVSVINPDGFSLAPNITFSQPSLVANADIGTDFALEGPALAGTASGKAQVPLQLTFVDDSLGQTVVRNQAISGLVTGTCGVGNGTSLYADSGHSKPRVAFKRLASANATNPAGSYTATISITVAPN